jgi:protein-disulfide isomerase
MIIIDRLHPIYINSTKEDSMREIFNIRSRNLNILSLIILSIICFYSQGFSEKITHKLPGTTAHTLSAEWQNFLVTTMQSGECPCDTTKTLFQCIQKEICPQATDLAIFAIEKINKGLNQEQVTDAVIKKYVSDFVPPATFDLSKTAFKGDSNGKIVIVEFADFECPHCSLMSDILKEVIKANPKGVKVYFKQFPLPHHTYAQKASFATLAAQKQGSFWPMHDLIFANQSTLTPSIFDEFAQQIGLNLEQFRKDMGDPIFAEQIQNDKKEGIQAGLEGTPTLFFNGKQFRDEPTLESINKHIASLQKAFTKPSK